jgi:hypothetical protein
MGYVAAESAALDLALRSVFGRAPAPFGGATAGAEQPHSCAEEDERCGTDHSAFGDHSGDDREFNVGPS